MTLFGIVLLIIIILCPFIIVAIDVEDGLTSWSHIKISTFALYELLALFVAVLIFGIAYYSSLNYSNKWKKIETISITNTYIVPVKEHIKNDYLYVNDSTTVYALNVDPNTINGNNYIFTISETNFDYYYFYTIAEKDKLVSVHKDDFIEIAFSLRGCNCDVHLPYVRIETIQYKELKSHHGILWKCKYGEKTKIKKIYNCFYNGLDHNMLYLY